MANNRFERLKKVIGGLNPSGRPTAIATDDDGNILVSGGVTSGEAADGAMSPVGGIANAVAPSVDEGDSGLISMTLDSFIRFISKSFDPLTGADKVSPTLTDADRYLDSEELVDASLGANTYYYPSEDGMLTEEFNNLCFTVVASTNATFTLEATNDDDASPVWFDMTSLGFLGSDGSQGNASIASASDALFFPQFNFQKWRVKVVVASGPEANQVHVRRRYN